MTTYIGGFFDTLERAARVAVRCKWSLYYFVISWVAMVKSASAPSFPSISIRT